jgi:Capsular polysaccharide synthesis protein/Polysaccharide pyruvyl transferase
MFMNKIIWSCWFQGRHHAPDLVQRCLASWETLNPDWEFRCLDAENIRHYVDLDAYIDLQNQTITAASLSDILRILLLHEYGGVWVDATLYCNQPLDEWLPLSMGAGFFAFSKPAPDRLLSSWFIAAEVGNQLIEKWTVQVIKYWHGRKQSDDYFWFHHQFGEMCSIDREARAAWESVPKISADGPHAIQKNGMYEPVETVGKKIDWTTPVFKLTYRFDEKSYQPDCLLYALLHSRDLIERQKQKKSESDIREQARIVGLKVSTENLGDHIQILSAMRLLKRMGFVSDQWVDRDDEIATLPGIASEQRSAGILLNGWFKTNPSEWPPHPLLVPVYLGFHIRLFQSPTLVSDEALNHYRRFGPVGCRDKYTVSLLRSRGVDAFLSHCLTLTLSRRISDPENQTETIIVSRDKKILDYLPDTIRSGKFISHYSGITDFPANMRQAEDILAFYRSRAKVIVTTLLHCALPAIAMGIPVVVFFPPNKNAQHLSDQERFSSLSEIIRVFHLEEINHVDWRGYTTDVSRIKLMLIERLFEMSQRWGTHPKTRLEPIAPSSALPVPTKNSSIDYYADPNRLLAHAKASAPDRNRWGDPLSYKSGWGERAKLAASLIPDGVHVLEIGVGAGDFKKLIQHRCIYIGADLEPLTSDTFSLDLDRDSLPKGHYDYIVALGVFEYLHQPREAALKISVATTSIVLSYCCTRNPTPNIIDARYKRGWVNHFSESEFTEMFVSLGFQIMSRALFKSTDDFEQIVFEFRSEKTS